MRNGERTARRPVQSCITNVGFPADLDAVDAMLEKNEYVGDSLTDIETLLEFSPDNGTCWTAPKWLTTGDIVFFYHALTARQKIRQLLRCAQAEQPQDETLLRVLRRADLLAARYSGSIFAVGLVGGPSIFIDDPEGVHHFRSTSFAPLENVVPLERPVHANEFRAIVKIARQATITPVCGTTFDQLRVMLSAHNELPRFLRRTVGADIGFRSVSKDTWRRIISRRGVAFLHEEQLRTYFADYLLDELKDRRTPVLQECRCKVNGRETGIADYFLKICGRWVPVEAKLSVASERDPIAQVAKYISVDEFFPTRGPHRGQRFVGDECSACIVIDKEGLYVLGRSGFVGAREWRPLIRRVDLPHLEIEQLRATLHELTL